MFFLLIGEDENEDEDGDGNEEDDDTHNGSEETWKKNQKRADKRKARYEDAVKDENGKKQGEAKEQEEEKPARKCNSEDIPTRMKKTSTPRKVKIRSILGREPQTKLLSPKPKCLKRLQPRTSAPSPARTSCLTPKQIICSTGQESTRNLLSKWEHLAQLNLTSAVNTKPKLRDIVDSQPGCSKQKSTRKSNLSDGL